MYNTSNPAELYAGTTWELLPNNKFLKTGSTPLQQAGSNSIKITKANLPTDKLQVESHSMTRGSMNITGTHSFTGAENSHFWGSATGAFTTLNRIASGAFGFYGHFQDVNDGFKFDASRSWSGSTSSASPYTTAMGNGTPLTINPEHVTIRAWKRLS